MKLQSRAKHVLYVNSLLWVGLGRSNREQKEAGFPASWKLEVRAKKDLHVIIIRRLKQLIH